MRRRDQASAELREAVEGREDEFWGIGFIGVKMLLGLAIYFQLAGPLGRGVSTLVGWFTGLGKFIVPICLVGVGVALVRKGRSGHRFRLAIGWALTGVSILAVLHVVRRQADGFDSLGEAGGWIGALVGEPLRALLADAGAIVVLAALFLGGVMLITRTSVRTLAHQSARSVGAVAGPLSRRLRDAVGNVASLRSEREGQGERGTAHGRLQVADRRVTGAAMSTGRARRGSGSASVHTRARRHSSTRGRRPAT